MFKMEIRPVYRREKGRYIMKIYYCNIHANQDTDKFVFQIPVRWEMKAALSVEARTLKDAIQIVNSNEYDLPKGEYVMDPFEIDYDRLED